MWAEIIRKIQKKKRKWYRNYQIALLRAQGATIGNNVNIRGKIYIDGKAQNLIIGDDCVLNEGVLLNCRDTLTLGRGCYISAFTQIHTAALIVDQLPRKHRQGPVCIGEDVWIAAQCILNPGISIADRCVIGGNSTVTKSIDTAGTFYAGNPARFIRNIDYSNSPEIA